MDDWSKYKSKNCEMKGNYILNKLKNIDLSNSLFSVLYFIMNMKVEVENIKY